VDWPRRSALQPLSIDIAAARPHVINVEQILVETALPINQGPADGSEMERRMPPEIRCISSGCSRNPHEASGAQQVLAERVSVSTD
jgi:hypothetical protein